MGKNTKRDASVEVYRCGLTFGIVLLHVICQGGYYQRGLDRVLLSCVDGFVFISGYYGLRFSVRKVLSIVSIGIFCAIVVACMEANSIYEIFCSACKTLVSSQYWFMWAYVILAIFSPIIEIAFQVLHNNRLQMIKTFAPILGMVFGWMYLTQIPGGDKFIPKPSGFGPCTFLCLLGIYISGRFFRYLNGETYLNRKVLTVGIIICGGMCLMGFGHYHSIFALGMACLTFCLFKHTEFPSLIGTGAIKIAPSMLSIYLLHCNSVGFGYCKKLDAFFIEQYQIHIWIAWVLTAAVIFVACLCIDCMRRGLLGWGKHLLDMMKR